MSDSFSLAERPSACRVPAEELQTKSATGPFDREHLLSYLEKEALEHKDREDYVFYTEKKR